jgi:membrane protein implicated in regulation of membrane protease activity
VLKITNPWVLLIIGFVLLGMTAFEFQGLIFALASLIPFVLSLYFVSRYIEEPKQVEW